MSDVAVHNFRNVSAPDRASSVLATVVEVVVGDEDEDEDDELDVGAAVTVMPITTDRAAPAEEVPTSVIVWAPAGVLAGMVSDPATTPCAFAVRVPMVCGVDASCAVTEDEGVQPDD
jgi:hypothetical protein